MSMTLTEYYNILAESWAAVDKDDLAQIHEYNETVRELRRQLAKSKEE